MIWYNKPIRHYIITTDQGRFEVDREYMNYKETIKKLAAKGYTNIKINCLGYRMPEV